MAAIMVASATEATAMAVIGDNLSSRLPTSSRQTFDKERGV